MLEKTIKRLEKLENNIVPKKSREEVEAQIAKLFKMAEPEKIAAALKAAGYQPKEIQYLFFAATRAGAIKPKDNKSEYWEGLYD